MDKNLILAVGIMTGNSLDGADTVLSSFSADGAITDLCQHSKASPPELTAALRELRSIVNDCSGDIQQSEETFDKINGGAESESNQESEVKPASFEELSEMYNHFVASAVKELLEKSREVLKSSGEVRTPDIVGFHGQTCAHFPPSIAKTNDLSKVYTVQLGDGQLLADTLNLTVAYDFRSDDLMNGGEGAPLAPMHHAHLARSLKNKGTFPVVFCNAGNTGNLSVVSTSIDNGEEHLLGWDCGPCNALPDTLMREERGLICDRDGKVGKTGKVNSELLELLFEKSVVTNDGSNFLLKLPPKSSDPQWYKIIDQLSAKGTLPFEDRLRTAEYFAAYCFYFSLSLLPNEVKMPAHFILCGGGWQNPVLKKHLQGLVKGDFKRNPVLAQHLQSFKELNKRIKASGVPSCELSDQFGFNSAAMEARVFADAAVCRVKGEPFSVPEVTAVTKPCVLGILRFPQGKIENATPLLSSLLEPNLKLTKDNPAKFSRRWNRATAGWKKRLAGGG